MNYRESHNKKVHNLRVGHPNSQLKCGSAAIPSKKPPVPQYFLEYTKKKSPHHNKQNKISRQSNQTSFWAEGDKSAKGKSIYLCKGSVQRTSHGKLEDNRMKKLRKDPYQCQKNSKSKKNPYKNLREPRSTIEVSHSNSIQRIRKTEWNINVDEQIKPKMKLDLNCREKIKKTKTRKHITSDKSNTTSQLFMSSQTLAKTPSQQIAQFKSQTEQIQIQTQSEAIAQIAIKENEQYRLDINNILRKQPNISWIKRAIAINWMMETLCDFGSKRQTFAVSVRLLDHYLALSEPIPLEELQKLAATAMYIANKLEDHIFGAKDIGECIGNSGDLILTYELKMVTKLKWKLNPPTANMWANRLSIQWDQYIEKYSKESEVISQGLGRIKFWSEDTDGYYNYRDLMQLIDFSILEVNTLRYHCRDLAAGFMYILLIIRLNIHSKDEVIGKFPDTSTYLLTTTQFNLYFNQFLHSSFGFGLRDLLPAVQYCSTFMILPKCYKLPHAVNGQDQEQITYSQFCSFQTWNQNNLTSLYQRDRTYE